VELVDPQCTLTRLFNLLRLPSETRQSPFSMIGRYLARTNIHFLSLPPLEISSSGLPKRRRRVGNGQDTCFNFQVLNISSRSHVGINATSYPSIPSSSFSSFLPSCNATVDQIFLFSPRIQ